MSARQPSPELARRAVAFDRVIEALRAVADLSDADITEVFAGDIRPDLNAPRLLVVRNAVRRSLDALAAPDAALNAELSALDSEASCRRTI